MPPNDLLSTTQRYQSLDVLRGLTIALMVVVNTPGSWSAVYEPLKHASWHGFTVTDLVFPSFLFVVGNAMSFSMAKFKLKSNGAFFSKVGKRALIIFSIGFLLGMFPFFRVVDGQYELIDLGSIRWMGVLQRIALCYFLAALLIRFTTKRLTILIIIAILMGYWGIMYWFGEGEDPFALLGNAARKFDLWVIGEAHLYKGEGVPFDPEGLLSTLPATVNVLGGYLVGIYLQRITSKEKAAYMLFATGLILILLGLVWDPFFPINKKIWTSSFVLYTIGWSTGILAILICLLEVFQLKSWAYFFEVYGRNPLVLYVLSGVLARIMMVIYIGGVMSKVYIFENLFAPFLPLNLASFLFSVAFMLLIWLIGFLMDKKRIYIKV
ncbi:acyltransferase family protein [Pleomorphovibrio marinus]|uniref:acyltransferase family protein n=1 Tax=Pleomorphovibrio marinus TaxID=2164132 RepID=UPI000E0BBC51|nr:heparan-alpha-glucosaminide N-acetyltransferase domain-containing protein [Pleomorphovibrio marinus]